MPDYKEWTNQLVQVLNKFIQSFTSHLPNIVGAILLLLVGWILAKILKRLSHRVLMWLDQLIKRRSVQSGLEPTGINLPAEGVISRIVFWVVFLFFFAAAAEILGQPVISTWAGTVAKYFPRVLVASLILVAGLLVGNLARSAIIRGTGSSGISHGELLGGLGKALVVLMALLIAVNQVGINVGFLIGVLTILIGTFSGGAALAFALGARTTVSNLIASHYLLQKYQVGQRVRIEGMEGKISEITRTAVILETEQGRAMIPAKEFSEKISTLLKGGA